MRVVFAGTPEPAVPSLRAVLHGGRHEVVAVLTRPDARTGRGRKVSRSAVAAEADAAGVEVLTPSSARDAELRDRLAELAPDAVPVVAYGDLVPPALLDLPRHGWVNLHFSLLPAWRGAAPVNAAIAAGDEITGASTFRLDQGLDTGPVFGTVTERIGEDDTAGALLDRLAVSGAGLLAATLDGIEDGTLVPVPQSADGVSHAGKLTVDDARVRWSDPALAVRRRVRSVTPAPGAWTTLDGDRVKIGGLSRTVQEGVPALPPGRLHVSRTALHVGTATEPLRVDLVQPPGKRMMSALDWARGARLDDESCFA